MLSGLSPQMLIIRGGDRKHRPGGGQEPGGRLLRDPTLRDALEFRNVHTAAPDPPSAASLTPGARLSKAS